MSKSTKDERAFDDIDLTILPDEWRRADALLLCPVARELDGVSAAALEAGAVGAVGPGDELTIEGEKGRIAVAVAPSLPERIYATVPFYKETYKKAGISPSAAKLPFSAAPRRWPSADEASP